MLTRPDRLDPAERRQVQQLLARCPHLMATAAHVTAFAEMLTGPHGIRLNDWIAAAGADNLPHLHSFTNGLNAITPPHSTR